MADVYSRLAELGMTLPSVATPAGSYLPAVRSGNHVYVSGQLPLIDGARQPPARWGRRSPPSRRTSWPPDAR